MKASKQTGCLVMATVVAVSLILISIKFYNTTQSVLAAESRGHAYRLFFIVLEEHAEQTGKFPRSVDEVAQLSSSATSGEYKWSADAAYILELIKPNFNVSHIPGNLGNFVSGYKANASWAWRECEFYWEQMLEHCLPIDEP